MKTTPCIIAALAIVGAGSPALARSFYTALGGSIPDFTTGSPGLITSDLLVPDSFAVTDATVTLDGLSHTWAGDLIITLQKVGGPSATLVSRIGVTGGNAFGDSSNFAGTYTFANMGGPTPGPNLWSEAALGPSGYILRSGQYQASGAGSGAANNAMSAFAGVGSAGLWRLTITDHAAGDVGALGSWTLSIVPTPGSMAVVGLAVFAGIRRRR